MTTMLAARAHYYEVNQFGADGGDSLAWVPVKVLGITFQIPNTDGRRRAVRVHDLHHVLTGYSTDLAGEAEIGAWELASNCLSSAAATVLNTGAMAMGMLIAPRRTARAWARGRATRNLYANETVDHLLGREVDDMRADLGLDGPPPPVRARDLATLAAIVPLLALVGLLTTLFGLGAVVVLGLLRLLGVGRRHGR
jgi:hypothetical protein